MNRPLNKIITNKTLVFGILIIICSTILFKTIQTSNIYVIQWQRLADIPVSPATSYYLDPNDYLPSADGTEFSPPERSIFFHETSTRGYLDPRQACGVESAARAHPEWQLNIIFSAPITKKALSEGNLAVIQKFDNVKLFRIHIEKYAEGTPVESLITSGALNKTRWRVFHTSDVLRYLTLYKWPGIYLDFDMLIAKPLDLLTKNWAAKEDDSSVNSAALAFSSDKIGRTMANATIMNLKKTFNGDQWNNNGPGVITRVLKELCTTDKVKNMCAATCGGFEVYEPRYIYPIPWQRSNDYFKVRELAENERDAFGYHTWSHLVVKTKIVKGSPYAKLAENYCPTVFNNNAEHFGTKSKINSVS